jgi:hypothetical protein
VLSYFKRHGLLTSDEVLDMKTWQGSGGFSLHGDVLIEARDRKGLERLIRYCARPAFASERLKSSADGEHLEYCFKERNLLGLPKRQKRWGLQRGAMQCSPLVAVRAGFPRRRKYNRKQSRSLAAELLKKAKPNRRIETQADGTRAIRQARTRDPAAEKTSTSLSWRIGSEFPQPEAGNGACR